MRFEIIVFLLITLTEALIPKRGRKHFPPKKILKIRLSESSSPSFDQYSELAEATVSGALFALTGDSGSPDFDLEKVLRCMAPKFCAIYEKGYSFDPDKERCVKRTARIQKRELELKEECAATEAEDPLAS